MKKEGRDIFFKLMNCHLVSEMRKSFSLFFDIKKPFLILKIYNNNNFYVMNY